MDLIDWECDGNGTPAFMLLSRTTRFIPRSAASAIVKYLMHEVSTISASFTNDGMIVFSRIAGISVFEEKYAEYYGLYASDDGVEKVGYCVRRCTWQHSFRSKEEVLKRLSSQTLFFNTQSLREPHQGAVIKADRENKADYQILSGSSMDEVFANKAVSYFVSDDEKELRATYDGGVAHNPSIEELFHGFKAIFHELEGGDGITPLPNSLRISYSFFSAAEILGLNNGQ